MILIPYLEWKYHNFVDNFDYHTGKVFTADGTYIKVRGIRSYRTRGDVCLPLSKKISAIFKVH